MWEARCWLAEGSAGGSGGGGCFGLTRKEGEGGGRGGGSGDGSIVSGQRSDYRINGTEYTYIHTHTPEKYIDKKKIPLGMMLGNI